MMTVTEDCIAWADKIDGRLGPISGADADRLAKFLRRMGEEIERWYVDRHDQDCAIASEIRCSAALADELAFWRYQAIWIRAYLHESTIESSPSPESSDGWKRAERELEALRRDENRQRSSHAEAPRDPGGT